MSSTEPIPVSVARSWLAEFDQADRAGWDRETYADAAHRLARGLRDTLAAYDALAGSAS